MVLLRCTKEEFKVIKEGDYLELFKDLENITMFKESNGQMFVNQYSVGNDYRTIVREFATIKEGFVDNLIICTGLVNKVK